jgi:hypothetical protein
MRNKGKFTPDKMQEHHSENEDFTYSFTSRVGKIRKNKNKLIKVSKKPDYIGALGYISMQPHSPYTPFEVHKEENPSALLQEAIQTKRSLSKRGIPVSYKVILSQSSPTKAKNFPIGGEFLLRV